MQTGSIKCYLLTSLFLEFTACFIGEKGCSNRNLRKVTKCKLISYLGEDKNKSFVIRIVGTSDENARDAVHEIYDKLEKFPLAKQNRMLSNFRIEYGDRPMY